MQLTAIFLPKFNFNKVVTFGQYKNCRIWQLQVKSPVLYDIVEQTDHFFKQYKHSFANFMSAYLYFLKRHLPFSPPQ
ncbi:hypothetical protein C7N43_12230 [Sphingobacteriales bacterium UPWRP_1]|nr:hypothetical protein B6N25_13915 [Sphingobacteriales bacterium TSM_CSS]PSJ76710.1 hypothetical protein C7N43_12230 [Sphingobacteriales bacterium UPWRP_1]